MALKHATLRQLRVFEAVARKEFLRQEAGTFLADWAHAIPRRNRHESHSTSRR